jgi:hypothetical protein
MGSDSNKRTKDTFLKWAYLATGITVVAWVALLLAYRGNFGTSLSNDRVAWGAFGDYVGGLLNPFLGTMTLFGVLYTVYLQRDLLRATRRAERNQRVLNQQQGFENVFFQMLNAINTRSTQVAIMVKASDIEPPITDTALNPRYAKSPTAVRTATGAEAFALFIKLFGEKALRPVNRGDFHGRDNNEVLREKSRELISEYDHAVGPVLRSMGDLLIYIDDYGKQFSRINQGDDRTIGISANHDTALQPPAFYARVATNSRTRWEMKVFAMYVGCGLASERVSRVARAYDVFEIVGGERWWGSEAFLSDATAASETTSI